MQARVDSRIVSPGSAPLSPGIHVQVKNQIIHRRLDFTRPIRFISRRAWLLRVSNVSSLHRIHWDAAADDIKVFRDVGFEGGEECLP